MSLPSVNFLQLTVAEVYPGSRSLRQGQRSNQGQTMTLHTYTSEPMSLPSINFLHVKVSEIQPGQSFPAAHPPAHLDTMGENNIPTELRLFA